jgi:hypothetical protein
MLAGLIFATQSADDRPNVLAETLPFGGVTLIEFQARQLIAAGVSQIVVVVARLTPELLGAAGRIARRGITIDTVRGAQEAADKLHPLARLLVVADGLITSQSVIDMMAAEGAAALLVLHEDDAESEYERLGGQAAWAGLARLDARRIAEVAALPRDYDFQSTLLRVAAQAGAGHMPMPRHAAIGMHGIERDSRALMERSKALLAERVSQRPSWADRQIVGRLARLALPWLAGRSVPTIALGGAAAFFGLASLLFSWFGWLDTGLITGFVALVIAATGAALAWLRDERALALAQQGWGPLITAASLLLVARWTALDSDSPVPWIVAGVALIFAVLAERAGNARIRRFWWGSAPGYLIVLAALTIANLPFVGISAVAGYAALTLAGAIEALREKP